MTNKNKISNLRDGTILALIIFAALLLRTYHLGEKSLHMDEGLSILISNKKNIIDFYHSLLISGQQPFYHLILSVWIKLFGDSELICRIPSVIFGVLTVLSAYKLGLLLFNHSTGITAALLTSLSVFQINFSTLARPYILISLLSSLSFYFFIKILKENNLRNSISYVLFNVLSLYNHTVGFFLILVQFICLIFLKIYKKGDYKADFKSWIIYQSFIFNLFSLWLYTLIRQLINSPARLAWISDPGLSTIHTTFSIYSSKSSVLFFIYIALALCAIILSRKKVEIFFVISFLIIPIAAIFLSSKILFPLYNQSYTNISCIPFYILISAGIQHLKKPIKIISLLVIILLLTGSLKTYFYNAYPFEHTKTEWREAVKYIDETARPNDLVIFYPRHIEKIYFDYYTKRNDIRKTGLQKPFNEKQANELRKIISNYKRFWVITCLYDPLTEVINNEKYKINVIEDFYLIRIENYTKK